MIDENETPEMREARLQLEQTAVLVARHLKSLFEGTGTGFALVLFDFGGDGNMAYVANGVRADISKMFRELSDKLAIERDAKPASSGKD